MDGTTLIYGLTRYACGTLPKCSLLLFLQPLAPVRIGGTYGTFECQVAMRENDDPSLRRQYRVCGKGIEDARATSLR